MTDKQVIKDFVDMMENPIRTPDTTPVSYVKMTTSYKALKTSISLVSEENTHVKQCPGFKVNLYKDVCECPLEKATDTQDNDGWIEASTVQNITLQPQQKIEIKTFCQKILSIGAADVPWKLCGLSVPYSIIAYRIIKEPKDYNKNDRQTPCCNKSQERGDKGLIYWNGFNGEVQCHACGMAFKMPEKKETKKQTLEEFAIRNTPYGNLDVLTPGEIISLISEYVKSK